MPDLRGKVAIITGASSGIGKGTAVEFAGLGAHLALTGRNQENLQATADTCVEAGTPRDKHPNGLAYCMSKSALDQFTRCVALELASKQIRVNSVNPGYVPTEILKRAGFSEEQVTQTLERVKSGHALGRLGEVEEVAKTIAFLASSDASFITGAQVPVDGGRQVMCPR
ncbi:L-xylulose reductase-like [Branchiostoma floridae x Branchiostoma japonicum]